MRHLALLLLTGCMIQGPEVIMPDDPEYALVCEVEDPPPECWVDTAVIWLEITTATYPEGL